MPEEKKDLIKLFGVEGQVTPRTLLDDKQKDIEDRTPYQISQETIELIHMMNTFILEQNIEKVIKTIAAIQIRVSLMQETAFSIKNIIDNMKKNDGD